MREKLEESIREVTDALGVADEVATALRSAGAELRGALGIQTNNPPRDVRILPGSDNILGERK